MDKQQILSRVRAELRGQLERTMSASLAAREQATDEQSRAVSKYDTQAVEASYLAAGQAARAEQLALAIQAFGQTTFPAFARDASIVVGALVEVELEGERSYYLLAGAGGGSCCEIDGRELTVLAPSAPLAKKLLGAKAGDVLRDPRLRILSVA